MKLFTDCVSPALPPGLEFLVPALSLAEGRAVSGARNTLQI